MLKLETKPRKVGEKLEHIREEGFIPAVFYGKKQASTPVSVNLIDFVKIWKKAGETSVVTLSTPEGELEALIKDIDLEPVTETPRHADFYVFEKGQKIELEVPLEFVGVAPAVKDLSGILIKVLHEVTVEALPKDLPREIPVDISSLVTFESQILAKDLALPTGVELKTSPDEVVALVAEPKEEVVEEAPVDLSAIEVEKKGKKEEEGAEAADAAGKGGEKAEKKGE